MSADETPAVSRAVVATGRSDRYARQLVSHLGRHHGGEWDAEVRAGWIDLGTGHVRLTASDGSLELQIAGADDAGRLEEVVGGHLVRFGARDELSVVWERPAAGNSQDLSDGDGIVVSRRRLLAIAGGAGLATLAAGCSGPAKTVPAATATTPSEGVTVLPATPAEASTPPRTVVESPAPAVSGVMLCREAWGARPALPGGRPHTIDRMTLHHSAVALPDNRGIVARLQQHQRYHQDDKGWVDIAYHVAVDREGNIFRLRDTTIAGDTATDYDTTGHFLVLAEGNFDEEPVSAAQLSSTVLVFAWAAQQYGLSADTLASHREVASGTSCPGQNLEAHMTSGDLRQRVADLLDVGVELRTICGPEADEHVAAIQAGR